MSRFSFENIATDDRQRMMRRALDAAFDDFPMSINADYAEVWQLERGRGRTCVFAADVGPYDRVRIEEQDLKLVIDPRDGISKMLQRFVDRVWHVNDCREAIRDLVDP